MGVDHEIEVINEGIAEVYDVLYKINYQLDSTLVNLNSSLNTVDEKINEAVIHVGRFEQDVVNVTSNLQLEVTYYLVLIILIVLLNILALYLLFHIYQLFVEMRLRSDKIVRNYMKKVYKPIQREDSLEDIETPPPTYDEYVKTADLYVKYHRNGTVSSEVIPNVPDV